MNNSHNVFEMCCHSTAKDELRGSKCTGRNLGPLQKLTANETLITLCICLAKAQHRVTAFPGALTTARSENPSVGLSPGGTAGETLHTVSMTCSVPGADTWKLTPSSSWILGSNSQLLGNPGIHIHPWPFWSAGDKSRASPKTSENWYSQSPHRTSPSSLSSSNLPHCLWKPWVLFSIWDFMRSNFSPSEIRPEITLCAEQHSSCLGPDSHECL